ncbi:hypothetical protein CDL15_Pgr010860 [Punica granatum]|uniref:Uncharacterized protein n=1 Tax=Punica granatum TaxID=22663 RepID=A0A218W753_PUNGR|nr:hypothetical protein CDL15_Pgr010860 [Punica granatum]
MDKERGEQQLRLFNRAGDQGKVVAEDLLRASWENNDHIGLDDRPAWMFLPRL